MAQGLQIFDDDGNIVLDTGDRIAGDWAEINTGKSDGSWTMAKGAGQSVLFVYNLPSNWLPAGVASRWPSITVNGDTVSWSFLSVVPENARVAVNIVGVTY